MACESARPLLLSSSGHLLYSRKNEVPQGGHGRTPKGVDGVLESNWRQAGERRDLSLRECPGCRPVIECTDQNRIQHRESPMKCSLQMAAVVAALILSSPGVAADNELNDEEKQAGWQLLFNGKDLAGWKCNNGKPIAAPVEQQSLVPYKSGGYIIVHERPVENFVLKCDVRWEDPRCNSGIFFRVEDPRNPVHTGFEIQVMSGDKVGKHQFGAIYDLVSTTKNAGKETGEWNTVEIRCDGPYINVKLNGEAIAAMNCDKFDQPGVCPDGARHKYKLNGKPRAVKDFSRKGFLGFQDHGHKVWYKNIKLLELKLPE